MDISRQSLEKTDAQISDFFFPHNDAIQFVFSADVGKCRN